jgi:hypothetical protein
MRDIVSPLDGFPSPLRRLRGSTAAAFSPASLFAYGEEGALLLPGPTTSFLSTTDLTPAGAGDTVGFQLDTSQGAGYSGGSFTGLGSELVTNGTFDSDVSGWTTGSLVFGVPSLTNVSSRARISGTATNGFPYFAQSFSTTSGKSYRLSVDYFAGTASGYLFRIGTTPEGFDILNGSVASGSPNNRTIEVVFTATSSTTHITFGVGISPAGTYNEWDNISVRELPGRMQTQITAAARPTLQDSPDQIDFDGVDDFHRVVLPAMSNATVAYASPGVGAVILTGQTITAGNYDWDTDHAGLIILDRPLTASETTGLTAFLNARAGV